MTIDLERQAPTQILKENRSLYSFKTHHSSLHLNLLIKKNQYKEGEPNQNLSLVPKKNKTKTFPTKIEIETKNNNTPATRVQNIVETQYVRWSHLLD